MYSFDSPEEDGSSRSPDDGAATTKRMASPSHLPRTSTPLTVAETETDSIQFRFSSSAEWEEGGTTTTTTKPRRNHHHHKRKKKHQTSMETPACSPSDDDDRSVRRRETLRGVVTEYLAKLVLEVMGGAGAIWGFSEAVGLRTQDNLWFWRPAALSVGLIFFLRWFGQVRRAVGPLLPRRERLLPVVSSLPTNSSSPLCSPHSLRRCYSTPTRGIELQASRTFDDTDEEEEQDHPRRQLCLSSGSSDEEEDHHAGSSDLDDLYLDAENPQTEATALTTAMAVPIQHGGPVLIPTQSPMRRTRTR